MKLYKKGSEATLLIDHQTKIELGTHLPGKYNVYNLAAAAAATYVMGIDLEAIADGIAEVKAIPGRFERVEVDKPYDVVVDYAPLAPIRSSSCLKRPGRWLQTGLS